MVWLVFTPLTSLAQSNSRYRTINLSQSLLSPFVHEPAWDQWQARCRSVAQGLSWPIAIAHGVLVWNSQS
ncbi:MAG: hypothetical protein WA902_05335 [Thermosynechococcaceae cyanobacterium]